MRRGGKGPQQGKWLFFLCWWLGQVVAEFTVKEVSQSCPLAAASNNITVTFQSAVNISAGGVVTLSNLANAIAPPSIALTGILNEGHALFSDGKGTFSFGSLRLTVHSAAMIWAHRHYAFSFEIQNPYDPQHAPSISIEATGSENITPVLMTQLNTKVLGITNGLNALYVVEPVFNVLSIEQSSPVAGVSNTITATLQANCDLALGSTITITGLGESETADAGSLAVNTTDDGFGMEGAWNRSTGTLILKSAGTWAAVWYEVKFTLTNSARNQAANRIWISGEVEAGAHDARIRGSAMKAPGTWLLGVRNGSDPLRTKVPTFDTKAIGQSNPLAAASNTITVTIQTDVDLGTAGDVVTISGLSGAVGGASLALTDVANGGDQLFNDGATQGFGAYSSGTLTLTVHTAVSAGRSYAFSFEIQNPSAAQAAPAVSIAASGSVAFAIAAMAQPATTVLGVSTGGNALYVVDPVLTLKSIEQSTPVAGVANTITVSLQANCDLAPTSTITITGLTGSQTADDGALPVTTSADLVATGDWKQTTGTLILTVDSSGTTQATPYEVKFTLTNAAADQAAGTPSINGVVEAGSNDATIAAGALDLLGTPLLGVANGYDPLETVLPTFDTKAIGQSNPLAAASNTITVTIQTDVDLGTAGDVVTISGLSGAVGGASLALTDVANGGDQLFNDGATQGFGAYSSGTLTLTVHTAVSAGRSYAFSFEIQNPSAAQAAPAVSIAASGSVAFAIAAMAQPATTVLGVSTGGNALYVVDPVLTLKSIEQSTPVAGVANTITVSLQANCDLAPTSTITITGLTGSQTADDGVLPVTTSADLVATGDWKQTTGTLILTVDSSGTTQATPYEVKFTLTNAAADQAAGTPSINGVVEAGSNDATIAAGALDLLGTPLLGVANGYDPLETVLPTFDTKAIGQSNPLAAASNTITVTIQTDVDLGTAGDVVTISGLSGAVGGASLALTDVANGGDQLFNDGATQGFGAYSSGTLTLTVHTAVSAGRSYAFSFEIQNPSAAQAAPAVSIAASGSVAFAIAAMAQPATTVLGVSTGGNALYVVDPVLTLKSIEQSTPVAGVANTITVSLQANCDLAPTSTITITGLTGSQTADDGVLPVTTSADLVATGDWKQTTGTLILTVDSSGTTQATPYEVKFTLTNAAADQAAGTPSINGVVEAGSNDATIAAGALDLLGTPLLGVANGYDPLETVLPTFDTKAIGQSNPLAAASNTITVTIQTDVDLGTAGDVVTISGLSGAVGGASLALTDVANGGDQLFNDGATQGFGAYSSGTLTLTVHTAVSAGRSYAFSFEIQNPSAAQAAPAVSIAASGSVAFAIAAMAQPATTVLGVSTGGNALYVVDPVLTLKSIEQSTPVAGVANTITVSLQANCDLAPTSTITITGLTGSQTADDGVLPVTTSADLVATGDWKQTTGTLILTVDSSGTTQATPYEVKFTLTNAAADQAAGTPSINGVVEAGSNDATIAAGALDLLGTPLLGVANGYDPLETVLPTFDTKAIGQSNPLAAASNTITVTIQTDVDLGTAGDVVTISGLSGAVGGASLALTDVANGGDQLFNDGATQGFGAYSSGTLTLTVHTAVSAGRSYAFSFEIQNPSAAQAAPAVSIAASGSVAFAIAAMAQPATTVLGVSTGGNALYVVDPVLTLKSIEQSTPVAGVANTITVSLQANCDLAPTSTITITGLTGSQTADDGALPVTTSADLVATGDWKQTTGTLILTVDSSGTTQATPYEVKFTLTNAAADQAAGTPSINGVVEAGSNDATIAAGALDLLGTPLLGVANGYDPLETVLPTFDTKAIGQSNPLAAASNTITVTIQTDVDLGTAGDVVTISGLSGAVGGASLALTDVANGGDQLFNDGATQGFGAYSSGTLTLTVHTAVSAGRSYAFSFEIQNPSAAQAAPAVSIAASGSVAFAIAAMAQPATTVLGVSTGGNALYVVDPVLTLKSIEQSTPVAGVANTITVSLQANCDLAPTSTITITGLTGSQTADDGVLPVTTSADLVATGDWKQTTGTLILTVDSSGTTQATPYEVKFTLTNAAADQAAGTPSINGVVEAGSNDATIAAGALDLLGTPLLGVANGYDPLETVLPTFDTKAIGQSNPLAAASNTITVTIQTDVDLGTAGDVVTISGLSGAVGGASLALTDVANGGDQLFNDGATQGFGAYSSGTLTLTVHTAVSAGRSYAFSFEIQNPSAAQAAPAVSIAASGSVAFAIAAMAQPATTVLGVSTGGNALYVVDPVLTLKSIEQSTPVAGVANTITVSLQANCDLAPTSTITITGLTGSQTADDGALPVTTSADLVATGDWKQTTGTLILTVDSSGTTQATPYEVKFTLTNAAADQAAGTPSINGVVEAGSNDATIAAGALDLLGTPLLGVANGYDPLETVLPTFDTKAIGQSNPLAAASNTITVTIQTDVDLGTAGDVVTISGLSGAVGGASLALTDVANGGDQLFNDGATQGFGAYSSGTLTLTVHTAVSAGRSYAFSFEIQNPSAAQAAPAVSIAASGSVAFASASMTQPGTALLGVSTGGNALHVVEPALTVKSMEQSTPVAGLANTITARLQANCDLATGSTITITGLTGLLTPADARLAVSTTDDAFGSSGEWNWSTGTLILESAGTYRPVQYTIDFNVTNPYSNRQLSAVFVSGIIEAGLHDAMLRESTMSFPGIEVAGVPNGSDPVITAVPQFIVKRIWQNTPVADADNMIGIDLQATVELRAGDRVIISGLQNASASCSVELVFPDPAHAFLVSDGESHSRGSYDAGTLSMHVNDGQKLRASTPYSFSFMVRNPRIPQDAPEIRISATGSVTFVPALMVAGSPQAMGLSKGGMAMFVADFCARGRECADPDCQRCVACRPGWFKAVDGFQPCTPCPPDSFREAPGAVEAAQCLRCPVGSSSQGLANCSSPDACVCSAQTYLVVTDAGFRVCEPCPLGAVCAGAEEGSCALRRSPEPACDGAALVGEWRRRGDGRFWLESCPAGHFLANASASGQECRACGRGEECRLEACARCSPCLPGYYKHAPAPAPCSPCPPDTYRPYPGAAELVACLACPPRSSTRGAVARTSLDECVCDEEYFLVVEGGSRQCRDCLAGALCEDRTCAFNKPNLTCGEAFGTWARGAGGAYLLVSCPAGTSLVRSPADEQRCRKCTLAEYILNPSTDTCQPCPAGLRCFGNATVAPRVPRSEWGVADGVLELRSCPTGYFVWPAGGSGQACVPCERGSECTAERCQECTLCQPGFYKDQDSTAPCAPCPVDTYLEEAGAAQRSRCLTCPAGSTTLNRTQSRSVTACVCDDALYFVIELDGEREARRCEVCPVGATCSAARYCALRNPTRDCGDGSGRVLGQWQQPGPPGLRGPAVLVSCPSGHSRVTAPHDSQRCEECSKLQYILDPNNHACQPCPRGLVCYGDATLAPRIVLSNWTREGALFKLQSCPPGFFVHLGAADGSEQECKVCSSGRDCTASFATMAIAQSTAVARATNTLTVTLQTQVELVPGDVVTISGLRNALSPTGSSVALSDVEGHSGSAALFWDGTRARAGLFEASAAGVLRLTVHTRPLSSLAAYAFSFALQNPPTPQPAPRVEIAASGSVAFRAAPMSQPEDALRRALYVVDACLKGSECSDPACSRCSECPPGWYSDTVGTEPCTPCPQNTHRAFPGAIERSACVECQLHSTTRGTNETSSEACACGPAYYLVVDGDGVRTCRSCPAGARCDNGACALASDPGPACAPPSEALVGTWERPGPAYAFTLHACPAGYSRVAAPHDAQACVACLEEQEYILDADFPCEPCPLGLRCYGNATVAPRVAGSVWVRAGRQYHLESCPSGYSVEAGASASGQECRACGRGEECRLEACARCSPCLPGYYKHAPAPAPCSPCPPDTFRSSAGAVDLSSCLECPARSSTLGLAARTSLHDCLCGAQYYLVLDANGARACSNCPYGATCAADGSCALRRANQTCDSEGGPTRILGEWRRGSGSTLDRFELAGCPTGFQLVRSAHNGEFNHDVQVCAPCAFGQYIIDGSKGHKCWNCPSGAVCDGSSLRGKVEGSEWEANETTGQYHLRSCPPGHELVNGTSAPQNLSAARAGSGADARGPPALVFSHDLQQCHPCDSSQYIVDPNRHACQCCPTGAFCDGSVLSGLVPGSVWRPDQNTQLVNSTDGTSKGVFSYRIQMCRECLVGREYIIDPNSHVCQACPSGASCTEQGFAPKTPGAEWVANAATGQYYLLRCPPGYELVNRIFGSFSHQAQECRKCTLAEYILNPSTDTCQPCPAGLRCFGNATVAPRVPRSEWIVQNRTYRLASCPEGYSMKGGVAGACQPCGTCSERGGFCARAEYCLDRTRFACALCPEGALCNGSHLQTRDALDASGEVQWRPDAEGRLWLQRCPPGHRLENATYELQQCRPCAPRTFILSAADPAFACQPCPASMACLDGRAPASGPLLSSALRIEGVGALTPEAREHVRRGLRKSFGVDVAVEISRFCFGAAGSECVDAGTRQEAAPTTMAASSAAARRAGEGEGGGGGEAALVVHFRAFSEAAEAAALQSALNSSFAALFVAELASVGRDVAVAAVSSEVGVEDVLAGRYQVRGLDLVLLDCPRGFLLINSSVATQRCQLCGALQYSMDPLEMCARPASAGPVVCAPRDCNDCPVGARCTGGANFEPLTAGSRWELEETKAGRKLMRLRECPPGYTLVRSDVEGAEKLDQCVRCQKDTYSAVPAVFPHTMAVMRAEDAGSQCKECEDGARCEGGNVVIANAGYWVLPTADWDAQDGARGSESVRDGARRKQRAMSSRNQSNTALTGDGRLMVYKCPKGACLDEGICALGREGLVCSFCQDGYALSGSRCVKCGRLLSKSYRILIFSTMAATAVVLLYFFSWRPLFTSRGSFLETVTNIKCFQCLAPLRRRAAALFHRFARSSITDHVKIIVSFLQIISTFETTFKVRWPWQVRTIIDFGLYFRLGILDLPGPNCLTTDTSYLTLLQGYALAPLAVALVLSVPTLILKSIAACRTYRRSPSPRRSSTVSIAVQAEQALADKRSKRLKDTEDLFFYSLMFWLFLLYPTLSVVTVQGFNCREIGSRRLLVNDLHLLCPLDSPRSAVFVWTVIGTLLFPLGIPLFMYSVLRYFRIPEIVHKKKSNLILREMMLKYRAMTEMTLRARIAAFIGGSEIHRHDHTIGQERIARMFAGALQTDAEQHAQRGGRDGERRLSVQSGWGESWLNRRDRDASVSSAGFIAYLHGIGLTGEHEEEIEQLFLQHDADRNRRLDWLEFQEMVWDIVNEFGQLTGRETVEDISDQQLEILIRHRWKDAFEEDDDGSIVKKQMKKLAHSVVAQSSSTALNRIPSIRNPKGEEEEEEEEDEHACPLEVWADGGKKLAWLIGKGKELRANGGIAIPVLRWDRNSADQDEANAIDRVGFLFEAYEMQYWYFELIEMGRKFAMTGLVNFLYPGSAQQLAAAFVLASAFLFYFVKSSPYTSINIDNLQTLSLSAQCVTLFYGLMLQVQSLQSRADVDGEEALDWVVFLLNVCIFVLPPLTLAYEHRADILKKCCGRTPPPAPASAPASGAPGAAQAIDIADIAVALNDTAPAGGSEGAQAAASILRAEAEAARSELERSREELEEARAELARVRGSTRWRAREEARQEHAHGGALTTGLSLDLEPHLLHPSQSAISESGAPQPPFPLPQREEEAESSTCEEGLSILSPWQPGQLPARSRSRREESSGEPSLASSSEGQRAGGSGASWSEASTALNSPDLAPLDLEDWLPLAPRGAFPAVPPEAVEQVLAEADLLAARIQAAASSSPSPSAQPARAFAFRAFRCLHRAKLVADALYADAEQLASEGGGGGGEGEEAWSVRSEGFRVRAKMAGLRRVLRAHLSPELWLQMQHRTPAFR